MLQKLVRDAFFYSFVLGTLLSRQCVCVFRSIHQEFWYKKVICNNLTKFAGKHLLWNLFLNKVVESNRDVLSLAKFLRRVFLQNTCDWVLLSVFSFRPDDGTKTFNLKVPDAITSWYASGFTISKQAGMRIANPMELRVFQPFFISLNLPYSVIRGEDVIVPAAIFSYLENACLSASLILQEILKFKTKIKVLY